ncbi:hypothetical protein vseg_013920 [Gypsophila vaccaria]
MISYAAVCSDAWVQLVLRSIRLVTLNHSSFLSACSRCFKDRLGQFGSRIVSCFPTHADRLNTFLSVSGDRLCDLRCASCDTTKKDISEVEFYGFWLVIVC